MFLAWSQSLELRPGLFGLHDLLEIAHSLFRFDVHELLELPQHMLFKD